VRRAACGIAGVGGVVAAAAVLWLGPGALAWSVRGLLAPAEPDAAWQLLPADVPIVVVAEPRRALGSVLARAVEPDLRELASLHGVDLALVRRHVERTLTAADGRDLVYTVGTGAMASPLLLPRFDSRWRRADVAGRPAVADDRVGVAALQPGQVLAAPVASLSGALALALAPRELEDSAVARLSAEEPDAALRADVRLDDALRRSLSSQLPSQAAAVLAALTRIELEAVPAETLRLSVRLEHRSEAEAQATQQLVFQVDALARLARRAGGLASLLGGDAALALDLPDLAVTRDGTTVHVRSDASPDLVRRWIRRAIAAR
jgi:hypothetical protein